MYDVICLSSGGLDSVVCLKIFQRQSLKALPVFINYGQLNYTDEFQSLLDNCKLHQFHEPKLFDLSSFGRNIETGLTSSYKDIVDDAFTPNRNLLFLTIGASVAYNHGCATVALGFLAEGTAIFPDQTDSFLRAAEDVLLASLGVSIRVVCPLRDFSKQDVVELASEIGVDLHYSCHAGGEPCGQCIACLEYGGT